MKTVLMFVGDQCGRARDAAHLYADSVPGLTLDAVTSLGPRLFRCDLSLGPLQLVAFDSDGPHDFTFTPAVSLWIDVATADELARVAAALGEGGRVHMPIADDGLSPASTWLDDRYGVSWQICVPREVL
jgi:predicted 3-demethylubiquinone-9 3-methyltransferase (glyoxalase superfamily)